MTPGTPGLCCRESTGHNHLAARAGWCSGQPPALPCLHPALPSPKQPCCSERCKIILQVTLCHKTGELILQMGRVKVFPPTLLHWDISPEMLPQIFVEAGQKSQLWISVIEKGKQPTTKIKTPHQTNSTATKKPKPKKNTRNKANKYRVGKIVAWISATASCSCEFAF